MKFFPHKAENNRLLNQPSNKNRFDNTGLPDRLYHFCLHFVQICMAVFTGLLFISGFLSTCFSTDMSTQLVLTKWDFIPASLLGMLLFGLFLWSGIRLTFRNNRPNSLTLLRFLVSGWCVLAGLALIVFGRTAPTADPRTVYTIAESLAAGNLDAIHPTDSYLSYYPHQLGLAAFWELLIRLWNLLPLSTPAYHFLKLVNVFLCLVIVIYGEKFVHALWADEKTDCLYLLLAGLNCPLLMYTSFIYGEIPSYAAVTVAFYLLVRLVRSAPSSNEASSRNLRFRLQIGTLAFGTFFFTTLSVLLRKNSLIFVIAAVIVLLLEGPRRRRGVALLLAAACAAGSLLILPGVQKIYEIRSGGSLSSGVPAISYFAMGMQESSRANGWYNGFNFYTYQDTGLSTEATTAISLEAIRERMAYMKDHPGYAAQFYLMKYLSQWADGTYACRQSTLATFGGRHPVFTSLYEGELCSCLIFYCNIYQNILYLGAFWFCLASLRPSSSSESPSEDFRLVFYSGLIASFGGFLFHMAWEGNSRYILPYGLALLPYTARGLVLLYRRLAVLCRRLSKSGSPSG